MTDPPPGDLSPPSPRDNEPSRPRALADSAADVRRMALALAAAREGAARDEVPIGAAVFRGEELLATAHDAKESLDDPTAHAEVLALREAARRSGDWRLDGCELYVTVEPCPMCAGAILQARIARVVFAARNPRWGAVVSRCSLLNEPVFNHRTAWCEGPGMPEAAEILQTYFRAKRKATDTES